MPSSRRALRAMLELVPGNTTGEIHELGSGWGTLAFALARRCPGATAVATERAWIPYAFLWIRQKLTPRPNLRLVFGDIHRAPLGQARGVVCYLFPAAMAQLAPRLQAELPPGAWILSNTFALPGWTPESVHVLPDLYRTRIYVYRRP